MELTYAQENRDIEPFDVDKVLPGESDVDEESDKEPDSEVEEGVFEDNAEPEAEEILEDDKGDSPE